MKSQLLNILKKKKFLNAFQSHYVKNMKVTSCLSRTVKQNFLKSLQLFNTVKGKKI